MNQKQIKGCEVIKRELGREFKTEKGILNTLKIKCGSGIPRAKRDKIEKELKVHKLKAMWGETCILIR